MLCILQLGLLCWAMQPFPIFSSREHRSGAFFCATSQVFPKRNKTKTICHDRVSLCNDVQFLLRPAEHCLAARIFFHPIGWEFRPEWATSYPLLAFSQLRHPISMARVAPYDHRTSNFQFEPCTPPGFTLCTSPDRKRKQFIPKETVRCVLDL